MINGVYSRSENILGIALVLLISCSVVFSISRTFNQNNALGEVYYSKTLPKFSQMTVPLSNYQWDSKTIKICIIKDKNLTNSYYAWVKISAQSWKLALREYTNRQDVWNITSKLIGSVKAVNEACSINLFIFDSYKELPGYPQQTGAYTSVQYNDQGKITSAQIYLCATVLHGNEKTDILLPPYAFRNSATHEIGHALGLKHMSVPQGLLMSPTFDFWKNRDQLPITTLELSALVKKYGNDGFD